MVWRQIGVKVLVSLVAAFSTAGAVGGDTVRQASSPEHEFSATERTYWAFQPVARPPVPAGFVANWGSNPVDAFVGEKLARHGLHPSPPADKATLLRRIGLDLIGFPPGPDEIREFLDDESPGSWERLVDRLLASPHYGERAARPWLDLARYAESTGFETDVTRPNAWRYRDYVIAACNADKPYDRFVREQIAGDELWPEDLQARVATAFLRHYPEEGNNKDLLLARQEILHDVTDVVGATFLGLTFNCARCHDHKYDPILQRDYYRLQAFFANIGHDDHIPLVSPERYLEYQQRLAVWERATAPIWREMGELLATQRKYSPDQLLARYPDYVIQAVNTPASQRTALQSQLVYLLSTKDCGTCPLRPKPYLDPDFKAPAGQLKDAARQRYEQLEKELAQFAHLKPDDIARGPGIVDISRTAPSTFVLQVGLHTSPREEVEPGFLSILAPEPLHITPPPGLESTGRRSALANWLTRSDHPLTARVMVNRIWHEHFGQGLVSAPSDMGLMGGGPSHPELLDWLADEFVRGGWSIKRLRRLLLTSNTYRQSSQHRDDAGRMDPSNQLLWRYSPRRLEAELIRDAALAVSGVLNSQLGGPSVFPPLPRGAATPAGGWSVSKREADWHRRSIYVFVRRNSRYPLLDIFDYPDTHESCGRRHTTTTPSQALMLLNDERLADCARALGERILTQTGADRNAQVQLAFQLTFSRSPDSWERDAALDFLDQQSSLLSRQTPAPDAAPWIRLAPDIPVVQAEALADLCLMLMNANEFVYRQ